MPADQFDNRDDPSKPPDAPPPGDLAPDKSAHEPPEMTKPEVQPAEPRTRQEHADEVPPAEDPQSDRDPVDQTPTERGGPERALTEAEQHEEGHSQTRSSEEQSGETLTREQREREQQLPPDNPAEDTDKAGEPGGLPNKPSEPRETNYEHGKRPAHTEAPADTIGPQDHEARYNDVLDRLQKAHVANLATDHVNTTDSDKKQWTAERNRIHGEIVDDLYNRASAVPCEYKAIIAGGLPGAGKTTILNEQTSIDLSKYLTINPDEIKEVLASKDLIPEIEGLSPMEASDLAHEESSVIAKYLARRAQAEGKNIIWDITMSRLESTQERIDSLRASGYGQIDAIFVDIPIEVSITRTQARHREDQEKWQAGHGMGGRFIPPEIIRQQADPEWGSKNKKNFESIKQSINNWAVLDNGVDHRRATLVDSNDFYETSPNPWEE